MPSYRPLKPGSWPNRSRQLKNRRVYRGYRYLSRKAGNLITPYLTPEAWSAMALIYRYLYGRQMESNEIERALSGTLMAPHAYWRARKTLREYARRRILDGALDRERSDMIQFLKLEQRWH